MNYKTLKFPILAIIEEKHGRYISPLLTNYEQLDLFCLKLLESRFNENYYDSLDDITPPEEPSEKVLNTISGYAKVVRDQYQLDLRHYKIHLSEKKMYEKIKNAIETKNGKDAFDVLVFRFEYQYEEVEFHSIQEFSETLLER